MFLPKPVARSSLPPHRLHWKKPGIARSTTTAPPACTIANPQPQHQGGVGPASPPRSTNRLTSEPSARALAPASQATARNHIPKPSSPQRQTPALVTAAVGAARCRCPASSRPHAHHTPLVARPPNPAGGTPDLVALSSTASPSAPTRRPPRGPGSRVRPNPPEKRREGPATAFPAGRMSCRQPARATARREER